MGHKISAIGLEVDQAKISVIKNLMPPTIVKGIISFLGHVGFYRRFIKDFSKIARPLCRLLKKDVKFDFDNTCKSAFDEIKARLYPMLWKHQIGARTLKLYVMSVIMLWEQCWGREHRTFSELCILLARSLMKLKRTIQLQKGKC